MNVTLKGVGQCHLYAGLERETVHAVHHAIITSMLLDAHHFKLSIKHEIQVPKVQYVNTTFIFCKLYVREHRMRLHKTLDISLN